MEWNDIFVREGTNSDAGRLAIGLIYVLNNTVLERPFCMRFVTAATANACVDVALIRNKAENAHGMAD